MFIDEVSLILKGGHGGAGRVSFHPPPMRGPDGGDGGKGGSLFIMVTSDLTALKRFSAKKEFQADNGEIGEANKRFGRTGKDLEIILPVGSVLTNKETGKILELNKVGERILAAEGGLGGRGNARFANSRNTTPRHAQPGLEGERNEFDITLKLIADFGLIGLPNAGKSSLLNELTQANVKTANYSFTTLEPNLGVLELPGQQPIILADIPGLIEGASEGKGLGIKFLKHIEKTGTLLHCITSESDDVGRDYRVVRNELGAYNPELLNKKEVVLLTKTDLVPEAEVKKNLQKLKKLSKKVFPISIHNFDQQEVFKEIFKLTT